MSETFNRNHIRKQLDEALKPDPVAGKRRTAVAMILLGNSRAEELLFIRRAEFEGDPWSGDVAFPGGGVEEHDIDSRATAERETLEEIGIKLPQEAYLGTLGSISGAFLPVSIACHVYHLSTLPPVTLNGEVVNTFSVPLEVLLEPERNRQRTFEYRGSHHSHPIIALDGYCDHFLWGISYRIMQNFFVLLGIDSLNS